MKHFCKCGARLTDVVELMHYVCPECYSEEAEPQTVITGTVRATNADCKCEHGYVKGAGFPEKRCENDAGYYSYDKEVYLCFEHSK